MKIRTTSCWNFEVGAVQKSVNLVDLVKSFHSSFYLQKSASIRPRTSLSNLGRDFIHSAFRLLPQALGAVADRQLGRENVLNKVQRIEVGKFVPDPTRREFGLMFVNWVWRCSSIDLHDDFSQILDFYSLLFDHFYPKNLLHFFRTKSTLAFEKIE